MGHQQKSIFKILDNIHLPDIKVSFTRLFYMISSSNNVSSYIINMVELSQYLRDKKKHSDHAELYCLCNKYLAHIYLTWILMSSKSWKSLPSKPSVKSFGSLLTSTLYLLDIHLTIKINAFSKILPLIHNLLNMLC